MTRVAVHGTGASVALDGARLVVAGFTARDHDSVARHIDELRSIGVEPPETIPAFYELDVGLVTTDQTIAVEGHTTSGEAEPVLVRADGALYLGIGSDHTDRALEAVNIRSAKAACRKPLGAVVVPLDLSDSDWDGIRLGCRVDGTMHQSAPLAQLLRPADLLDKWTMAGGDNSTDLVMLMGTVPLLSGTFIYGAEWTVSLELPTGVRLSHTYAVKES